MKKLAFTVFQDKVTKEVWTQDDPETIQNCLEATGASRSIKQDVYERNQGRAELAERLAQQWEKRRMARSGFHKYQEE